MKSAVPALEIRALSSSLGLSCPEEWCCTILVLSGHDDFENEKGSCHPHASECSVSGETTGWVCAYFPLDLQIQGISKHSS
jgi:hypothetical protein